MSDVDVRLQVNVLSTALLSILLVPHLLETAKRYPGIQPRVVILTSDAHYDGELDDAILAGPSPFRVMNSKEYYQKMFVPKSKSSNDIHTDYIQVRRRCLPLHMLRRSVRFVFSTHPPLVDLCPVLDVFIARALSDLLCDTPVISLVINPGLCRGTEFIRNLTGAQAMFLRILLRIVGRTAEEGGRQLTWGAIGAFQNPDELRGAILDSQAIAEVSDHCLGEEGKRRQNLIWVSTFPIGIHRRGSHSN